MSEYIKREDALKSVCNGCYWCESQNGRKLIEAGLQERCPSYLHVAAVPAADVRENVRGEWKKYNNNEKICSICHVRQLWINAVVYKFCPHCGSDMRGEPSIACRID